MSYETIIDGRLVRVTPVPFTTCRHCWCSGAESMPEVRRPVGTSADDTHYVVVDGEAMSVERKFSELRDGLYERSPESRERVEGLVAELSHAHYRDRTDGTCSRCGEPAPRFDDYTPKESPPEAPGFA